MSDTRRTMKKFVVRDNRLMVLTSPLTLAAMACIRMALNMWECRRTVWDLNNGSTVYPYCGGTQKEIIIFEMTKIIVFAAWNIPFPLVEPVNVQLIEIIDSLLEWHECHRYILRRDNLAGLVEQIIWNYDGDIDYLETAKRLLTSSKLDDVEKCRLMFAFCLRNEIETLSPALYDETYFPEVSSLQDIIDDEDNAMVGYWKYTLDGTIAKMNRENISSAESMFIGMAGVNNVYAVEYLWSFLKPDEQTEAAKKVMLAGNTKAVLFVLTRLNQAQQDQILSGFDGIFYLTQFADLRYFELAKSLWMHIRNNVEGKHFSRLIFKLAFELSNSYIFIDVATFLWNDAPDRLKQYVLNSDSRCLISFIKNSWFNCETYATLQFLPVILKDLKTEVKRKILWCQEFRKFFFRIISDGEIPAAAKRIIELCLPENHEATMFKRSMMYSDWAKTHCALLCRCRKCDELNEFLYYFEQDENNIAVYLAEVIISKEGFYKYPLLVLGFKNYCYVNDLINCTIPRGDTSRIVKKNIMSSKWMLLYCYKRLSQGHFQNVKDCFELYLESPDDQEEVKLELVRIGKSKPLLCGLFYNTDYLYIEEILLWLSSSERNLSQIKRDLCNPKQVILKMLQRFLIYKRRRIETGELSELSLIDEFLNWYFDTVEAIRDCKKRTLVDWNGRTKFCPVALREVNERNLEIINTWFNKDIFQ